MVYRRTFAPFVAGAPGAIDLTPMPLGVTPAWRRKGRQPPGTIAHERVHPVASRAGEQALAAET